MFWLPLPWAKSAAGAHVGSASARRQASQRKERRTRAGTLGRREAAAAAAEAVFGSGGRRLSEGKTQRACCQTPHPGPQHWTIASEGESMLRPQRQRMEVLPKAGGGRREEEEEET